MKKETLRSKIRALKNDCNGADTLEFLGDVAMLVVATAVCISIIAYVSAVSNMNYLCRRCVRSVETEGAYQQEKMNQLVTQLEPESGEKITVTCTRPDGEIQLRDSFGITVKSSYKLSMLSFGKQDVIVPISTTVRGASEVYWKDLAQDTVTP